MRHQIHARLCYARGRAQRFLNVVLATGARHPQNGQASAILSYVQPRFHPISSIHSGRSRIDLARFHVRRVSRLGDRSNRQPQRRRLLIGAQPRGAQPNLLHQNPRRSRQRLAHASHTRPAVHSIDFQREFSQFLSSASLFDDSCVQAIRVQLTVPEGVAPASSRAVVRASPPAQPELRSYP